MRPADTYPPWLGVALISLAALSYEVLLTRLFAIIQWHHFAYMVISLALLGFGASGTLLVFVRASWSRQPRYYFALNAIAFGIFSVVSFLVAQAVAFNPYELAWEPRQFLRLVAVYFLLMLPFFFAANALGLALISYPGRENSVYGADLLGAGLGSICVIGLLHFLSPQQALILVALFGIAAASVAMFSHLVRIYIFSGLAASLAVLVYFDIAPALQMSPYKDLSQSLMVKGAETITERTGPLGVVTLVSNDVVRPRHAPGLGLSSYAELPNQYSLFVDGHSAGAITRYEGDIQSLSFLGEATSSISFLGSEKKQVLVLGSGGGMAVLQALYHEAEVIDAVELNRDVTDLLTDNTPAFTNKVDKGSNINFIEMDPRAYVRSNESEKYDLIHLMLVDAYGSASAGLHALRESYLYTTEAIKDYLADLDKEGFLSITRWLEVPPRDSLKLFATAWRALTESGVAHPERHLILLRSWQTATLIVGKSELSQELLDETRVFARKYGFDLAYTPDIDPAEVNQFNALKQPYLYLGASAIASGDLDRWQEEYMFNIEPSTDDRPFYFHTFRWQYLDDFLGQEAGVAMAQVEWGYLVLLATLVLAVIGSLVFILLPLFLRLRKISDEGRSRVARWKVLIYFLGLGLGFMFVEIAFIGYFILLLGHPLYSVAIVLASFLLFAGLGSLLSKQVGRYKLRLVIFGIACLTITYWVFLPSMINASLGLPEAVRYLLAVTLIAPLAFLMGMPFPVGLNRIAQQMPPYVPWAWGVNGCASVIGVVLAKLVAMALGFSGVLILAMLVYLLCAWSRPPIRLSQMETP